MGNDDEKVLDVTDRVIDAAEGSAKSAHGLLQVVLRYVFNDPLTWGEELIVGLFTWMVFIGAAAAIRSHMHIRIDVIGPILANPRMNWLNTLTVIIGLAIIVTMVVACHEYVLQELVVESPMLGVSKGWFAMAMPTGLVLMMIHVLRILLDQGSAPVFRGETETLLADEK